jgi:hypothetical protein
MASSIGVNIARYPQVGRTDESAEPTPTAEAVNSAPAAPQTGGVENANPESLSAREIASGPAKSSQSAALVPVENPPVASSRDSTAAGTVRPLPDSTVAIVDVQPMIPIAGPTPTDGIGEPPAGYNEVQRLPPVDPSASAAADLQATPVAVAPYPATSTP